MKAIASNGIEINTGDPVLIRDRDNENWKYAHFSHKENKSNYPYINSYSHSIQCIPYKGNEHLVGTNNNYESYEEKQKKWIEKNNIKEGDKVKIIKKSFKNDNGWKTGWDSKMNNAINKIGIIESIGEYGIFIRIDNIGMFWYPYHILEKVEDRFEFRFGAKVRAVCEDNNNNKKIEGILIRYFPDYSCSYCIAINEQINNLAVGDIKWVKSIEYIE